MKKFVGVYFASQAKFKEWNQAPEEAHIAGVEEWNKWAEAHKEQITDRGAPLGRNIRVDQTGYSDQKSSICGYTVVIADTQEAAAAIFTNNPHVAQAGAWIEVLELVTAQ
jgi:ketopantoate hydroxymethyltransferase